MGTEIQAGTSSGSAAKALNQGVCTCPALSIALSQWKTSLSFSFYSRDNHYLREQQAAGRELAQALGDKAAIPKLLIPISSWLEETRLSS